MRFRSAAGLAVVAGVLAPAPAQATERFSVSLTGTWRTEAHQTDTTCYRLSDPESTDPIPFTGNFTSIETGQLRTVRRGKARARRERGRLEVGSTGRPLRLQIALDRRSDVYGTCKPTESGGDNPPPDCGPRTLTIGAGIFNDGAALSFGFVKSMADPLGHVTNQYFTPSDPFDHCIMADEQEWLGALNHEIEERVTYGAARLNRTALMDRRRRTLVFHGFAEGHPRKDERSADGEGVVTTTDYRLDWTLRLTRLRR